MIDSVGGVGPLQGISSNNRVKESAEDRSDKLREKPRAEKQTDIIQISREAQELSEAQAEEVAREVGRSLADQREQSLGADSSFLDESV